MKHCVCCGRFSQREQSERLRRDTETWAGDGATSDAERAADGSRQHDWETRRTLFVESVVAFAVVIYLLVVMCLTSVILWFHMCVDLSSIATVCWNGDALASCLSMRERRSMESITVTSHVITLAFCHVSYIRFQQNITPGYKMH